ncbi:MAG: helix-turn-helix domain-containing protein [Devosia sp.]
MAKRAHDWVAIEEDALLDFQFALIDAMGVAGLSKAELAEELGVSRARVSQMLDSDANPTIKVIARAMAVLGSKVRYDAAAVSNAKKSRRATTEDSFVESMVVARAADSGWAVQQRKREPANENKYWPHLRKVAA